jgi:hypothetical protein
MRARPDWGGTSSKSRSASLELLLSSCVPTSSLRSLPFGWTKWSRGTHTCTLTRCPLERITDPPTQPLCSTRVRSSRYIGSDVPPSPNVHLLLPPWLHPVPLAHAYARAHSPYATSYQQQCRVQYAHSNDLLLGFVCVGTPAPLCSQVPAPRRYLCGKHCVLCVESVSVLVRGTRCAGRLPRRSRTGVHREVPLGGRSIHAWNVRAVPRLRLVGSAPIRNGYPGEC